MSKEFSLEHFCEPLMDDPSYFSKPMFGGLAIYHSDLMRLVLMENPGDREYRNLKFDFDLWNGVLICTSREHHPSLMKQWPDLISHPVLGKWLYLTMDHPKLEKTLNQIIDAIETNDLRIGIIPGQRKSKTKKKKEISDQEN